MVKQVVIAEDKNTLTIQTTDVVSKPIQTTGSLKRFPKWGIGLLVAVGMTIGTVVALCLGKVFKSPKDELDHRLYYSLWLVYAGILPTFYFHLRIWFFSFIASALVFSAITLTYRSIIRLDKSTVYAKPKEGAKLNDRYGLLRVLFCARKKTTLTMTFLSVVSLVVVPLALIVTFTVPLNWWHFVAVVSSYTSGIWLWYNWWHRGKYAEVLPEKFDEPSSRYGGVPTLTKKRLDAMKRK